MKHLTMALVTAAALCGCATPGDSSSAPLSLPAEAFTAAECEHGGGQVEPNIGSGLCGNGTTPIGLVDESSDGAHPTEPSLCCAAPSDGLSAAECDDAGGRVEPNVGSGRCADGEAPIGLITASVTDGHPVEPDLCCAAPL